MFIVFWMERGKIARLVASVLICQLAGFVGSVFTAPAIAGWYVSIQKPFFTPPNWVFAPVWTVLFLLMGVSLFLVWEKGLENKEARLAFSVFGIQLALNVAWSLLFFGLQSPFLAFVEIVFLWIAILATAFLFWRISRKAGLLLMPYLLWVSFAAFLNCAIWLLN